VVSWQGVVAPANTPAPVLDRLEDAYRKALAVPETQKLLESLGYFPAFRGRSEMATLIREETAKWAAIIGELNIHLD
jgi:tripartite-type tricarboxylate transporter receptor subunit TctC